MSKMTEKDILMRDLSLRINDIRELANIATSTVQQAVRLLEYVSDELVKLESDIVYRLSKGHNNE
jgi:hypothetical protein